MRIAIDIDSTLHHYWDRLSDSARKRFGIELPYEEQFDWGITRLKPQQLQVCIDDTHAANAHVPDKFKALHIARLPGGEMTPEFAQHLHDFLTARH